MSTTMRNFGAFLAAILCLAFLIGLAAATHATPVHPRVSVAGAGWDGGQGSGSGAPNQTVTS